MTVSAVLDAVGRRRSPATMPADQERAPVREEGLQRDSADYGLDARGRALSLGRGEPEAGQSERPLDRAGLGIQAVVRRAACRHAFCAAESRPVGAWSPPAPLSRVIVSCDRTR